MASRMRNSAKAIIIEDGRILVIGKRDPVFGDWYLLPGGGQQFGETLHEALRREVHEEASIAVEIGELLFIREYIGANHEFAREDGDLHQVEFMFRCRRNPATDPANGHEPDTHQTRVEWMPVERLSEYPFFPKSLAPLLARLEDSSRRAAEQGSPPLGPIYLGDTN